MSIASEIGLPRGGRGRIRLDIGKLLTLRAEGYSLRQIAKAMHVSDATVRARLREQSHALPDPYFSALGIKGQKARLRALKRRKREAKAEAERQKATALQGELLKLGLLALIADRRPEPKREGAGPSGPA